MIKRIDRDNEPYRTILSIPKEKIYELFSLINQMDTQVLKQFSMINSVTLNVDLDITGENLMHKVILLDNSLKKEFHRLNMIKFLYQNGVNPDKPNRENQTPLHLACKNQYFSIVEYLISLDVDLNFKDNNGFTPFHYALMGKVELFIEPKENKDFIPKPKKINLKKKDDLINVKKDIWEKIKDSNFLQAISKTIDDSIYSDELISKLVLAFTKNLSETVLKLDNSVENINFIKKQIEVAKTEIEKNINDIWKFNDISELVIHNKEENSLKLDENELSPLKNINIDRQLKDKKDNIKKEIKDLCKKIKPEKYTKFSEEYTKFYKDFFEENKRYFRISRIIGAPPTEQTIYNLNTNIKYTNWEDFNKSKMYPLAIDLADNIINWDDMTFIGGSREITISHNINNIDIIKSYATIEEKVFHILANLSGKMNSFDPNDLSTATNEYSNIILSNPVDYILINIPYNLIFKKAPLVPPVDPFLNNYFLKYTKLFEQKNFASVLYNIASVVACSRSADNLTGIIQSAYCSLVLAIKNNETIISDETLNNAFKKYYIAEECLNPLGKDEKDKLFSMISILLDKDIDRNEIDDLFIKRNTYNLDKFNPNNQIDFDNQKKKVIKIITKEIENMTIKPLESDTLNILTYILNDFQPEDNDFFILDSELVFDGIFPGVTFDKYDEQVTNNLINKFVYLIKDRQTMLLLPYIYHLFEIFEKYGTEHDFNNYKNHSLKKLNESRHLGLYYQGLLPYGKDINPIDLELYNNNRAQPKVTINIMDPVTNTHFFLNDELDTNQLPFIGNYINNHVLSPMEKLKYFGYEIHKYRPPLESSVKILKERNKSYLLTILSKVTSSDSSQISLINLIDSNNKLSKIFTDIYPVINMIAELLYLHGDNGIIGTIDKIINKLNEYNGCILMFYYLLKKDNLYKIPKFNFYEIPVISKKGKFLYFDGGDTTIESIIPNQESSVIYNQGGLTRFKDLIRHINNNIIRGSYIIKKEALVRAKNNSLPPSIKSILPDFYKYNLILLIKNKLEEFYKTTDPIITKVNAIKKEVDNTSSVITYFIIGKLIQELISENCKNFVQKQTFRIISKLITKYGLTANTDIEMLVKSEDFNLLLSNTKIDLTLDTSKIENINVYQFSKPLNSENENINFIIYPDEYANSELLNLKYKLTLNDKIFEKLLENQINPYSLDLNNQSAIFPILKIQNFKIIKSLKTQNIDYREFSDIKALDFLIEKYNNHTSLLTNNDTDFKKWLSNFVYYQKNEVKTLILSNDKFGNNVPNYLEDSFEVICYLTNQYLSESLHKMDDNVKLKEYLEYSTINFNNYLFINENLPLIFKKEIDNFIQDLIDNKALEATKMKAVYLKLNNGRTKDKMKNECEAIEEEIKKYQKILKNDYINKKDINNTKIIERYKDLQYDTGTMTKLLSKMITHDKLNDSFDLLTFKLLSKESKLINNLKPDEQLNLLTKFYENTNNISEIYFTFGKYTANNKVKCFAKDTIVFMIKHFIIFPYTMILRKSLFIYFQSIYPNLDFIEINKYVSYCFNTKYVYEGDLKNLEELLYSDNIIKKIMNYNINMFEDSDEELQFNSQNIKEILDNIIMLLTINPVMPILPDSKFIENMKEVNSYFDNFVPKTILNWLVIFENTLKFNINQGRIIRCIFEILN